MKNFWALTILALLTTGCSAGIGCNVSFLGGCGEQDSTGNDFNPYNPYPAPTSSFPATTTTTGSWNTLDDFNSSTGAAAQATASDASGNIYAAGYGFDASSVEHWIVRKFSAGSWSTIDDYQYPGGLDAEVLSIVCDTSGNVFVAGYAIDSGALKHWIVREYSGGAWTTIDDFQYLDLANSNPIPSAITSDFSGNVYVAGFGYDGSFVQHWIVRKYSVGAWSTIDDYNYLGGQSSSATALAKDTSGNIYAAGVGSDGSSVQHWIVRKYTSGSWSTTDDFQYASGLPSHANTIGADLAGNVYAGGFGNNNAGEEHWLVRKYTAGSWSTSDDFLYLNLTNSSPFASSLATDTAGNVYVAGGGSDNSGFQHWIVRKESGGTWSTFDDYQYPFGTNTQTYATSIIATPNGDIYSAGIATDSSNVLHWIVRLYY